MPGVHRRIVSAPENLERGDFQQDQSARFQHAREFTHRLNIVLDPRVIKHIERGHDIEGGRGVRQPEHISLGHPTPASPGGENRERREVNPVGFTEGRQVLEIPAGAAASVEYPARPFSALAQERGEKGSSSGLRSV